LLIGSGKMLEKTSAEQSSGHETIKNTTRI
jgi:hypothetical protein